MGIATRRFTPDKPYNWRDAQTQALKTTIWYPASAAAVEEPQWIGGPNFPMFSGGVGAPDAAMASAPEKFPLLVVSHGTGGSATIEAVVKFFGKNL